MNFKHLRYFWATAHAGGVVAAGEQLHTTPQTISSQIKLLEEQLGCKLLRKRGRKLELTDDGRAALRIADEIFLLGSELTSTMRERRRHARPIEFRVGVADSVAKTVAYRLLRPALELDSPVRLMVSEGRMPELLGQMAVHRLDLLLADEPLSRRLGVKAFNHALGSSAVGFFAAAAVRRTMQGAFPQCLDDAPMLIHGQDTPFRTQLDAWFAKHGVRPRIVGEFDDGALTKEFGRAGRGVFMAPSVLEAEICAQFDVSLLGQSADLRAEYFAISVERRITHPCVVAVTTAARQGFLDA